MALSKSLGQHFLTNKKAIADIVAATNVSKGDNIIEIGPGTGAITEPLAAVAEKVGAKLFAIEKDTKLVIDIQKAISLLRNNVEHGDALELLPILVGKLEGEPYKLVGNIPYYITGGLLRVIGELPHKPTKIVLMVQKEVAERVSAKPGAMNLLAAATQYWGSPRVLFTLKPKDFTPAPEVSSAVIEIVPKEKSGSASLETEKYYRLIKIAFKQPRKTLLNNLSEGFPEVSRGGVAQILDKMSLPATSRAQDLDVSALLKLTLALPL